MDNTFQEYIRKCIYFSDLTVTLQLNIFITVKWLAINLYKSSGTSSTERSYNLVDYCSMHVFIFRDKVIALFGQNSVLKW